MSPSRLQDRNHKLNILLIVVLERKRYRLWLTPAVTWEINEGSFSCRLRVHQPALLIQKTKNLLQQYVVQALDPPIALTCYRYFEFFAPHRSPLIHSQLQILSVWQGGG